MTRLVFEGEELDCREGESVLDALLRQGKSPPFSCRSGSCLVCVRRAGRGTPPPKSQRALPVHLRELNYFLPCRCRPAPDVDLLEVLPPRPEDIVDLPIAVDGRAKAQIAEGNRERMPASEPDHEMWSALGEGELMRTILTDFYTRVFADTILSPYFQGITKERVIGQVYGFMRDHFTGTRQYFGMRPRTGHHWMVISDAIFDHREAIMATTLREHGLAEHLVARWLAFEAGFRGDIVKPTPWKLVVDGVEMPLDGFGEEELTVGSICDGCTREIDVGERVRYHLRLGRMFCRECSSDGKRASAGGAGG